MMKVPSALILEGHPHPSFQFFFFPFLYVFAQSSISFAGHLAELERVLETTSSSSSTSSSSVVVENLRAYLQIIDVASILRLDYDISDHAFQPFRDCSSATCLRNRVLKRLLPLSLLLCTLSGKLKSQEHSRSRQLTLVKQSSINAFLQPRNPISRSSTPRVDLVEGTSSERDKPTKPTTIRCISSDQRQGGLLHKDNINTTQISWPPPFWKPQAPAEGGVTTATEKSQNATQEMEIDLAI
ncbi:hypothetical protein HAX54_001641 [Datura stramonium]|uniref:Uncharacterized protein n=1 Tax=Datura stramonium TaxID=4076 RepID=A0ABS8T2N9_DATST|nr:hypothetical protein [Datura stramonium]